MLISSFNNEVERNLKTRIESLFDNQQYEEVIDLILPLNDEIINGYQSYMLAFALQQLKRYEQALKYYEVAEKKGFDEFWIRYNRAQLYQLIGKEEEAIEDLKRAYEIDPEHPELKALIEKYIM